MSHGVWIVFVAMALFSPVSSSAEGRDPAMRLEDLRPRGAAEFRYDETRSLELMDKPWKAWGYMLSSAGGSLVKLQLSPKRIVMAISTQQMVYYDPSQKRRHTAPLSSAGREQQQITLFRSIMQGHIEDLKTLYNITEERQGGRWTVRLTPKPSQTEATVRSIEISSDGDRSKRQILIREASGEATQYLLEKTREGHAVDSAIQRLLHEARGE
jgi:hypothetical protein